MLNQLLLNKGNANKGLTWTEPNETANIQSFMNRKSHSNFLMLFTLEIDTFYTKEGGKDTKDFIFWKKKDQ